MRLQKIQYVYIALFLQMFPTTFIVMNHYLTDVVWYMFLSKIGGKMGFLIIDSNEIGRNEKKIYISFAPPKLKSSVMKETNYTKMNYTK